MQDYDLMPPYDSMKYNTILAAIFDAEARYCTGSAESINDIVSEQKEAILPTTIKLLIDRRSGIY
jgi:hypothetical protein